MKNYSFWLVVGSQDLYGNETLHQVDEHSKIIADSLSMDLFIPFPVKFKPVVRNSKEILSIINEANAAEDCAGIITWMHTFSPAKMWIAGLSALKKPLLHLNTQFNRDIPWNEIDMDFMNLNQSAHGDREYGHIGTRLHISRKVVAGFWQDDDVKLSIASYMRAAVGAMESKSTRVLRLGDNMRNVAVTDGDKIEAQAKLGWQIEYYATGDLIDELNKVSEEEAREQYEKYVMIYDMDTDDISSVKYQAKEQVALKKFMDMRGFNAFHTNFEDLHGLDQLPGLAVQDLMRQGYGFAGEGDWKTAALARVMKQMAYGLSGGTAFMEDYTYHMETGNEMILGAHMLEVDPTLAVDKPKIQVHPLGIGGKIPPQGLCLSQSREKELSHLLLM